MSIIDCKLKIPRQNNWKGHPFYYEILKTVEKISNVIPTSIENILSIPIWFNKYLATKFDVELSRAGFNFVKDLFPGTSLITLDIHTDPEPRMGFSNCLRASKGGSTLTEPLQINT